MSDRVSNGLSTIPVLIYGSLVERLYRGRSGTMVTHKASIDPRLDAEIRRVGDGGDVEAIVTIRGVCAPEGDERGLLGQVLDRLTHRLHEHPEKVRYMPRLGTLY